MAETVGFVCSGALLNNKVVSPVSGHGSHGTNRFARRVPVGPRRAAVVMASDANQEREPGFTETALGFVVTPDPPPYPEEASKTPKNKKQKSITPTKALRTSGRATRSTKNTRSRTNPMRGSIIPAKPAGGIVHGPEAVLGVVFVVFAYLKEIADHFGRLGTGLENLSERDMERHLRRALGRVQALEAAQEVDRKARHELEHRLAKAERNRNGSASSLRKAQVDADATSESLAAALKQTKAELTFAKETLADLRAKELSAEPSAEADAGSLDELEVEQTKKLAELQHKLETSAQLLNREISEGEKSKQRVGELESHMENSQTELKTMYIRAKELEMELISKSEELDKLAKEMKVEAQSAERQINGLIQEKRDLQQKVADLEQRNESYKKEISSLDHASRLDSTSSIDLKSAMKESESAKLMMDDLAKLTAELTEVDSENTGGRDPVLVARLQAIRFSEGSVVAELTKALEAHFGMLETRKIDLERSQKEVAALLDTKNQEVKLLHELEAEKEKVLEAALLQLNVEEQDNQAFLERLTMAESRLTELSRVSDMHIAGMQKSLDEQVALQRESAEGLRVSLEENEALRARLVEAERIQAQNSPSKNAPEKSRRERAPRNSASTGDYLDRLTQSRP